MPPPQFCTSDLDDRLVMGDILGQSSKKEDLAGLVLFDGNSYFEKNKKDGANALSLLSVTEPKQRSLPT